VSETKLYLGGAVLLPRGSGRGIRETLRPVDGAAQVRRTVAGALRNWGDPQFRKYSVTLQCSDQVPPSVAGLWPGTALTVDCLTPLPYVAAGAVVVLPRDPVPGSVRAEDADTGARVPVLSVEGRTVTLDAPTAATVVYFRPRLACLVAALNIDFDEYGAATSWQLDLEEV